MSWLLYTACMKPPVYRQMFIMEFNFAGRKIYLHSYAYSNTFSFLFAPRNLEFEGER